MGVKVVAGHVPFVQVEAGSFAVKLIATFVEPLLRPLEDA
jgi:hypothetical protein